MDKIIDVCSCCISNMDHIRSQLKTLMIYLDFVYYFYVVRKFAKIFAEPLDVY